jgi:hypothetical protein
MSNPTSTELKPLPALRRFVEPRTASEYCELCSLELPADHPHLLELAGRRLMCCCQACAILIGNAQNARYRRVSCRVERLAGFSIDDDVWDRLQLPINLTFFCHETALDRVVARYPSPAGAMQSLLELDVWQSLMAVNPVLAGFEPDVEALLVNRLEKRRDYYRVPIDQCYRLIGLIRINWQGFSGGLAVHAAIDEFFAALRTADEAFRK